ncbi:MAG TPA: hypothetical protein VFI42_05085 [Thermomicrobiaceae bacterium]|nr:hypothetical protein [Thermomicrobiaceae bacterium]
MADLSVLTQQRIDQLLDLLIADWQELPEVAAEIDSWEPIERLDFIEE